MSKRSKRNKNKNNNDADGNDPKLSSKNDLGDEVTPKNNAEEQKNEEFPAGDSNPTANTHDSNNAEGSNATHVPEANKNTNEGSVHHEHNQHENAGNEGLKHQENNQNEGQVEPIKEPEYHSVQEPAYKDHDVNNPVHHHDVGPTEKDLQEELVHDLVEPVAEPVQSTSHESHQHNNENTHQEHTHQEPIKEPEYHSVQEPAYYDKDVNKPIHHHDVGPTEKELQEELVHDLVDPVVEPKKEENHYVEQKQTNVQDESKQEPIKEPEYHSVQEPAYYDKDVNKPIHHHDVGPTEKDLQEQLVHDLVEPAATSNLGESSNFQVVHSADNEEAQTDSSQIQSQFVELNSVDINASQRSEFETLRKAEEEEELEKLEDLKKLAVEEGIVQPKLDDSEPVPAQEIITQTPEGGANLAEDEPAQILRKAEKLSEEAKALSDNKEYNKAIETNKEALTTLKVSLFTPKTTEFRRMLELKNILLNNTSRCYLSLKEYNDALWCAERVIITDKENTKALFAIAICKESKQEYTAAFEKLKEIKDIHTRKNLSITSEIEEAYARLQARCIPAPLSEITTDKHTPSQSANENRKITPQKKRNPIQQGFLMFPSALASFMIVKYVLKGDIRAPKSFTGFMVLALSLFGAFRAKRPSTRTLFALTAALVTGVAYKFKIK